MKGNISYSEEIHIRVSAELFTGLQTACTEHGLAMQDLMREAVAAKLIDLGVYLSPECPENPAKQWPEGGVNHLLARKMREILPELRKKIGDLPERFGMPRFEAVLEELRALDDPGAYCYAFEKISDALDGRITPLQAVRFVSERIRDVSLRVKAQAT